MCKQLLASCFFQDSPFFGVLVSADHTLPTKTCTMDISFFPVSLWPPAVTNMFSLCDIFMSGLLEGFAHFSEMGIGRVSS